MEKNAQCDMVEDYMGNLLFSLFMVQPVLGVDNKQDHPVTGNLI